MISAIKTVFAATMTAACMLSAAAQTVKFPQPEQPGVAYANHTGTRYTLSNNLLSASFTNDNGKVVFDGCPEMGLLPGSELF